VTKQQEGPYPLKRGDLTGLAAHIYVPSRRGARHIADGFSRALLISKKNRHFGDAFAHDLAGEVAARLPEGVDLLVTPPPGRYSQARQWYFARELGQAVSSLSGIPLARPLRWKQGLAGAEDAKATVSHAGKARGLAREAECLDLLPGQRCAIIDDGFTTGITAAQTAAALEAVGAEVVGVFTLAMTERTEHRPPHERVHLLRKRRQRAAKGVRQ